MSDLTPRFSLLAERPADADTSSVLADSGSNRPQASGLFGCNESEGKKVMRDRHEFLSPNSGGDVGDKLASPLAFRARLEATAARRRSIRNLAGRVLRGELTLAQADAALAVAR